MSSERLEARANSSSRPASAKRIREAQRHRSSPSRRFHLSAGVQQSYVMYDAFIEGIGVGVTSGAQRIPWVNDAYVSAGLRFGRFAGEYRIVSHGRDYRSAAGRHPYGTIALSVVSR